MDAFENLHNLHKEKYGVEPNVIGYLWDDLDEQMNLLIKAVEGDKPYDEYKMLSKDEQKAFDKGELDF
ncbi:MAG TPA: hypothetical protein EYN33_07430 [Gammaproteobacteria bacterium]|jgi:hypothetical protein|nr:hypothetical protein [Gammaproteobacteria bacterium]